MDNEPSKSFYIFYQLMNFYCHITEKRIYIRGEQGLPYEKMLAKVDETLKFCNATNAALPHWPSEKQIAAMNDTLRWGRAGNGKYSLEINFATQFYNSSFIQCFNKNITQWADDLQHAENQGLIITAAVITLLSVAALVTYCYCRRNTNFCGPSYKTIEDQGVFNANNTNPNPTNSSRQNNYKTINPIEGL